jgi:hypothetical protein
MDGVGDIRDVPEFHDCQRFIVRDASNELRFDSLFAIFASFRLDRLDSLLRWEKLDSANMRTVPPIDGVSGQTAVPSAVVVAWGDYQPLHIRRGFNCLYVHRAPGREGLMTWKAYMRPHTGDDLPNCSAPVPLSQIAQQEELRVVAYQVPGLAASDYPASARWDWDAASAEQYIGIRCGSAWCQIGSARFRPSEPSEQALTQLSQQPTEVQKVASIKGWYDEQYLAALPGQSGSTIRPTGILARISPDPRLELTNSNVTPGHWVTVATIDIVEVTTQGDGTMDAITDNAVTQYEQRFNLSPNRTTTVWLCKGSADECQVLADAAGSITDLAEAEKKCEHRDEWDSNPWWARLDQPGRSSVYRCVSFYSVPGQVTDSDDSTLDFEIPASTRWRWLVDDDGGWIACESGCCEML